MAQPQPSPFLYWLKKAESNSKRSGAHIDSQSPHRHSCTGSGRRPHSRLPAQRRGKEAKCLIHGKDTHTSRERFPAPRGRLLIRMGRRNTTHTAGNPAHSVGVPLTHTNPAQRTLHVMRDSSRSREEAGIATRHVVAAYISQTRKSPVGRTHGLILLTSATDCLPTPAAAAQWYWRGFLLC